MKMDKKKTQLYAIYKRFIWDLQKPVDWKWQDGQIFIMLLDFKRKSTSTKELDFKPKTVTWNEEEHYIIIKGSVQEENITIQNTYASNWECLNM